MKGAISNFRSARHHQKGNQMVVVVDGVDSREKAEKLVGKTVSWKSPSEKEIKGSVTAAHGKKGAVRVLFEKGMPGQSVSSSVKVE